MDDESLDPTFENNRKPFNNLLVIFGATGDLTHRKLLPAIYRLFSKKHVPEKFAVIGVARRDKSHNEFRSNIKEALEQYEKFDEKVWKKLKTKIFYYRLNFDITENYSGLKEFLNKLDKSIGRNRVFYLATMPRHFDSIINNLKKYNFVNRKAGKYRIVIEKPFGNDLKTARELTNTLYTLFREDEIYRIDHYLGKEAVQNLFALRFANRIFESVWNSKNIDNVQITVAESLGVESRGGYYDNYGALKDMVQNHLMQILMLTAMEPPKSFSTKEIKNEKIKVLKSVYIEDVVFGQYEGYAKEDRVDPNSRTETYSALRLKINNPRWKNTPFYLRTGKKLKKKATEVVVYFKDPETNTFADLVKPNILVIRLQPNEGIYLRFNVKKPGKGFDFDRVSLDFCHECLFDINTPEAYEKLIYEIMLGDLTLFTRWDEVEQAWKIIDAVKKPKPIKYKQGTWGPEQANNLMEEKHQHWREPM